MKYPRTMHLPNSPGFTKDDKVLKSVDHLLGKQVIYTEKLDGECTGMTRTHIHARSEESNHDESQSWVKQLYYNKIANIIPDNLQIFGENVYAEHSIKYNKLTTFFYVFGIVDLDRKVFLGVSDTLHLCNKYELEYVPILYQGEFNPNFKVPAKSDFGDIIEGYVVKTVDEFPITNMNLHVAKWVRANHVKSSKHWKKNWKPNELEKR